MRCIMRRRKLSRLKRIKSLRQQARHRKHRLRHWREMEEKLIAMRDESPFRSERILLTNMILKCRMNQTFER